MKTPTQYLKLAEASGVESCRPGLTLTVVGHMLNYTTRQKFEFVNLTEIVEELVGQTGVSDGMALV